MAEPTFLEAIGILQYLGFEYFLAPLLVFSILLGLLQKYQPFTDKLDLNAFAALSIALFVAMMPDASSFIFRIVPFFVVLLIVGFSISILFLFLGSSTEDIGKFVKKPFSVIFILIISAVISLYVISSMFGDLFAPPSLTPNATDYTGNNLQVFTAILSHPKVLGTIIFLLLLAITTFIIVYQM